MMMNELTTYLATVGDMLNEFSFGFLVADGTGRVEHTNQLLLQILGADPERSRLEAAIRRVAFRVNDVPLADTGRPAEGRTAPFIEVRTARSQYRVCASRMGSRVYVVLTQTSLPIERPVPTLPDATLLADQFRLTHRESDVAHLLARGRSNTHIAEELGISPFTARRHTERVLMKLNVRSRAEVSAKLLGLGDTTRERVG
jgi:DNA-binding CsgD family transcriptional regulator